MRNINVGQSSSVRVRRQILGEKRKTVALGPAGKVAIEQAAVVLAVIQVDVSGYL